MKARYHSTRLIPTTLVEAWGDMNPKITLSPVMRRLLLLLLLLHTAVGEIETKVGRWIAIIPIQQETIHPLTQHLSTITIYSYNRMEEYVVLYQI